MEKEIWKDVVGYEGIYEVSNLGNVRSCGILRGTVRGKLLKKLNGSTGYYIITLYKNEKPKNYKIHHLVLEAFLDKRKNGLVANHKNGNKKDNNISNLEYCTPSQNNKHAYDIGLKKPTIHKINPMAKLTVDDVKKIKEMLDKKEKSKVDIAKKYNVTKETIYNITNNKTWKHVK